MKKIPPIPDGKFMRSSANGQVYIPFSYMTYAKIGEDWYQIDKHCREITFPVVLKEDRVKKLLAKLA